MIRSCAVTMGLAIVLGALPGLATAAPLPRHRVLTADVAMDLARHALGQCRAQGFDVAVTILDPDGAVRLAVSSENASPLSAELSRRKARAVVLFRMSSGELATRMKANPAFAQAMASAAPDMAATQGATPILAGGEFVGAVGISGAPGGDKDEACAQAGISAVQPQLQ